MDCSQLFMSTTNIWKFLSSLFLVCVWKNRLGISGFIENKYSEKRRKTPEGAILNVQNQDFTMDEKIEVIHFKIILTNLYPALFIKRPQNVNLR